MSPKIIQAVSTAVLWLLARPAFAASTYWADTFTMQREAARTYGADDFARLEAIAQRYRTTDQRMTTGVWKMSWFYEGLEGTIGNQFFFKIDDDSIRTVLDRAERWKAAYPKSPVAQLIREQTLIQIAWAYRGQGWASKVEPSHWEPYRRYLEEARIELERVKPIASRNPEWYVDALRLAYEQHWEPVRMEALLDEGLKRYPLYYEIYFSGESYYLPIWHNDIPSIDRLAERASRAKTGKERTSLYSRVYAYAEQSDPSLQNGNLFKMTRASWPRMRAGYETMIRIYPDNWNINRYAHFACAAGDIPTLRKLLKRIGDDVIREAWESDTQKCLQIASPGGAGQSP